MVTYHEERETKIKKVKNHFKLQHEQTELWKYNLEGKLAVCSHNQITLSWAISLFSLCVISMKTFKGCCVT